jgi:hypothetical protein
VLSPVLRLVTSHVGVARDHEILAGLYIVSELFLLLLWGETTSLRNWASNGPNVDPPVICDLVLKDTCLETAFLCAPTTQLLVPTIQMTVISKTDEITFILTLPIYIS